MDNTMDSSFLAVWLLLALLAAAGLLYLWRHLRVNVLNPSGKGAERKTAGALKKFGAIRGFKVLSDITLEADGKTAHIENMLIGYFGILLVHTCGARGEYYGTVDGESWTVMTGSQNEGGPDSKRSFPNPLLEQRKAAAMLRTLFSRSKLYNIPIENIVYVSNKSNKTGVYITNGGEILLPGKLSGYLGKSKFEKDIGLDVAQLAGLIADNAKARDQSRK